MAADEAEKLGELRGALNALAGEHSRNWAQLYTMLNNHIDDEQATFRRIESRLAEILAWKAEMTGGMKVSLVIWKLWATGVSLFLAYLAYLKGSRP